MGPMTNDFSYEKLGRLRAGLNQSLERFARNRLSATSMSVTPRSQERRRVASSNSSAPSNLAGLRNERPSDDSQFLTSGGVVDDERQVRAMAKQIKRLIVEDRRRGLGIGG